MAFPYAPVAVTSMLLVVEKPLDKPGRNGLYSSHPQHGTSVVITIPDTYDEARKMAFKHFKNDLGFETYEDVVLKRSMFSQVNCRAVYADFAREDWKEVVKEQVGVSTLEMGVFKANDDAADDATLDDDAKSLRRARAVPMTTPLPPLPYSPYNSCVNLPGQPASKTMQIVYKDEMAIMKAPDSYEDCEKLAREIFPPATSEKTTVVIKMMQYDSRGVQIWATIHSSAYQQTIATSYLSPMTIRVDFETEKQKEKRMKEMREKEWSEARYATQYPIAPLPVYPQMMPEKKIGLVRKIIRALF